MEFIYNDRLEFIESKILQCQEMCLAVSFIRDSGINMLRPLYLESMMQRGNCKIIVDTQQRISEKVALQKLVDDGFMLKDHIGYGSYHPKVWLFKINDEWHALVGSMNMSLGALTSNIEALVSLHNDDALRVKNWFDAIWISPSYRQLDTNLINLLPDSIRLHYSRRSPEDTILQEPEVVTATLAYQDIIDFVYEWTQDTVSIAPGPSLRKTGWIFRPAHGDIDQAMLINLQRVLIAMFPTNDSFVLNEQSARQVYQNAGITFARATHITNIRDLLMKTVLNYLQRFGLIRKENGRTWNSAVITPLGIAYKSAHTNSLLPFFESALIRYNWFGISIHDYLKSLLRRISNNRVSYIEFFIIVRHAGISEYTYNSTTDIVSLINTYRSLSHAQIEHVWNTMEQLVIQNDESTSQSSFGNMRTNWVRGIYKDFAMCSDFCVVDSNNHMTDLNNPAISIEQTFLTLRSLVI